MSRRLSRAVRIQRACEATDDEPPAMEPVTPAGLSFRERCQTCSALPTDAQLLMTTIRSGWLIVELAILTPLATGIAYAQSPTLPVATAVPTPTVMPVSAGDTVEIILTARLADSVRLEKDRYLGERRDAETRWASLREQADKLKAAIAEVTDAISAVNAKEKQAKKDKRDSDRIFALTEKKQLERSLDLLEARYDLRRAEAEYARLLRDQLDAAIRANDAELAIAERQAQVVPNDPGQRTAFQELTSRWLQALRTRTARLYDVEDRRFKVIEAQLELLRRQRR